MRHGRRTGRLLESLYEPQWEQYFRSGLPCYELIGSIITKICDANMINFTTNENHIGRVNQPSGRWCYYHALDSEAFENIYIKNATCKGFIKIQSMVNAREGPHKGLQRPPIPWTATIVVRINLQPRNTIYTRGAIWTYQVLTPEEVLRTSGLT